LDLNVCFKCGAKETAKGWMNPPKEPIMSGPKFTPEELEARQRERGEISIDTVRDYMCFENPTATPEEAAFALWNRYPNTYSYEAFLKSTRMIVEVKEILDKHDGKKEKQ
jgi:hypothetical protein